MSHGFTSQKWLSPLEQQALSRVLTMCRSTDARNTLMIELAMKCGARASELLAIRKKDLNADFRTVHIRGIKNSNDRDVALNPDLFSRVLDYAKALGPDDLLFPISYQRLDQIWHEYRPVKKKFHALRHTFAIELYQKTKDILKVKRALGHRSLMNTMIYTEVQYSLEAIAADAL